jgi:type II secretory pathway pseudopilin PulG
MTPVAAGLLLVGALLIAALAGYALHLWRRVWRKERQQAVRQAEAQARQHADLAADLRILASSLLDEQLPLIEGAIRIKVLLDNYDTNLSQDPRCEVFQTLYDATAQIPTHGGWKALDKTERRRHEAHFSALELQYKAAARRSARWLLDEALTPAAA